MDSLKTLLNGLSFRINSFITKSEADTKFQDKSSAFSGQYADLEGLPQLSNVATSGDYTDLNGRPSVVSYGYTYSHTINHNDANFDAILTGDNTAIAIDNKSVYIYIDDWVHVTDFDISGRLTNSFYDESEKYFCVYYTDPFVVCYSYDGVNWHICNITDTIDDLPVMQIVAVRIWNSYVYVIYYTSNYNIYLGMWSYDRYSGTYNWTVNPQSFSIYEYYPVSCYTSNNKIYLDCVNAYTYTYKITLCMDLWDNYTSNATIHQFEVNTDVSMPFSYIKSVIKLSTDEDTDRSQYIALGVFGNLTRSSGIRYQLLYGEGYELPMTWTSIGPLIGEPVFWSYGSYGYINYANDSVTSLTVFDSKLIVMTVNRNGYVYIITSSDGGATWQCLGNSADDIKNQPTWGSSEYMFYPGCIKRGDNLFLFLTHSGKNVAQYILSEAIGNKSHTFVPHDMLTVGNPRTELPFNINTIYQYGNTYTVSSNYITNDFKYWRTNAPLLNDGTLRDSAVFNNTVVQLFTTSEDIILCWENTSGTITQQVLMSSSQVVNDSTLSVYEARIGADDNAVYVMIRFGSYNNSYIYPHGFVLDKQFNVTEVELDDLTRRFALISKKYMNGMWISDYNYNTSTDYYYMAVNPFANILSLSVSATYASVIYTGTYFIYQKSGYILRSDDGVHWIQITDTYIGTLSDLSVIDDTHVAGIRHESSYNYQMSKYTYTNTLFIINIITGEIQQQLLDCSSDYASLIVIDRTCYLYKSGSSVLKRAGNVSLITPDGLDVVPKLVDAFTPYFITTISESDVCDVLDDVFPPVDGGDIE